MDNDNPSQPNQNGKHKQTNNQFSRESGERELVHSLREEALRGAVTMKISMCFPKKKNKSKSKYDPTIPSLGICPKNSEFFSGDTFTYLYSCTIYNS